MTGKSIGRLFGTMLCVAGILSAVSCTTTTEPGPAEAAFKLRMNGKLDDAVRILEEALAQNPDDAASHFELSRAKCHASLGNTRQIAELVTEAQQSLDRALAQDTTNTVYAFYAGQFRLFSALLAMNMGEANAVEQVKGSCDAFATALRLKPDYHEAMLYLIEIYGSLPAEMGGDRSRAEAYMSDLETLDEIFGLKARSVLEEVGVAEWQALHEKHPDHTDVLEELGKAHLRAGAVTEAGTCFDAAVAIDSSMVALYLDLGRYHLVWTMENMTAEDQATQDSLQIHLAAAEAAMRRYLETDHSNPMQAYALRMLAHVKHGAGEEGERDRLKAEAKALDPYLSRATGSPSSVLFTPPGEIVHDHGYLFRPF